MNSRSATAGIGARIADAAVMVGGKRALAGQIGISEAQLYRYINDEVPPGLDVVIAIADVSSVRFEWLALGTGAVKEGQIQPIEDAGLELITRWMREYWTSSSRDERIWLKVQLERALPEFAEWIKKQDEARTKSKTRSGA